MSNFLSTIFICSLICGQVQAVSMDDPGIKRGVEIVPISRDDLSINRGTEIVPISLDDPSIKRGIELISISRDDPSINRGVEVVSISLDDPNINPGIEIVPISLGDPNINLGISIVPISLDGLDIRRGIEIISMGGSENIDEKADQDYKKGGEKLTEAKILDIVNRARGETYSRESKLQKLSRRFFKREREKIDIFKLRYEGNKTLLHLVLQGQMTNEVITKIINLSCTLPRGEQGAFLNEKDHRGMTAFHYAVRSGYLRMVQWFVNNHSENGIDLNAEDMHGRNAAHHAVLIKHRPTVGDMLSRLYAGGVDMTAQDNSRRSILHYAVKRGDSHIIRNVALYYKDIKATDSWGRNPFHYAAEVGLEAGLVILSKVLSKSQFPEQDIEDALGMFDQFGNTPVDIAENNSVESLKLDIP